MPLSGNDLHTLRQAASDEAWEEFVVKERDLAQLVRDQDPKLNPLINAAFTRIDARERATQATPVAEPAATAEPAQVDKPHWSQEGDVVLPFSGGAIRESRGPTGQTFWTQEAGASLPIQNSKYVGRAEPGGLPDIPQAAGANAVSTERTNDML